MLRQLRSQVEIPSVDLEGLIETIRYVEGDVRRVAGLEAAAEALALARSELEAAERSARPVTKAISTARFLPARFFR